MRKIRSVTSFDPLTCKPLLNVFIKDGQNKARVSHGLTREGVEDGWNPTVQVEMVDLVLSENQLPAMTDEEREWFLVRYNRSITPENHNNVTIEDLQKLAGIQPKQPDVRHNKESNTMSDIDTAIKEQFETYVAENAKFEVKGVKAAAARARKALGEIGKLAKARRAEIQAKKNAAE